MVKFFMECGNLSCKNKRVLVIAADCAPIGGSHSIRVNRMINSILSAGISVDVLTTGSPELHPQYDPKAFAMPDSVKIFHIEMGSIHKKLYRSQKKEMFNPKYTALEKTSEDTVKNSIKQFAKKAFNYFSVPDSMIDWYWTYKRSKEILVQLEQENYSLILSCSMPNTTHLIAADISKKLGIPLALDIADPWAYINGYSKRPIRHFVQRLLEQKIVRKSVFVVFSTVGAKKLYVDKYHIRESKTLTVLTGYSASQRNRAIDYATANNSESNSGSTLKMIYGGAILPGVRDPKPLVDALTVQSGNVHMDFYVDLVDYINSILTSSVKNKVSVFGYIFYDELMLQLFQSDVLVLFGNSTVDQLPGKVFEYIATGKHILYLLNCKKEEDQVLPILMNYGKYVVAENNCESITRAIDLLCKKKENEELSQNFAQPDEYYMDANQFRQISDYIGALFKNETE